MCVAVWLLENPGRTAAPLVLLEFGKSCCAATWGEVCVCFWGAFRCVMTCSWSHSRRFLARKRLNPFARQPACPVTDIVELLGKSVAFLSLVVRG